MENVCLFGSCLIEKFLSFLNVLLNHKLFNRYFPLLPIHPSLVIFSPSLMSKRSFVVSIFSFSSPPFFKSLRFSSSFKLPLFSHEYLCNCYNWALIKLVVCFPKKKLEQIGLMMFTQMHVHPPPILLNNGVHPRQQSIFGNTHYCNSTANPNGVP